MPDAQHRVREDLHLRLTSLRPDLDRPEQSTDELGGLARSLGQLPCSVVEGCQPRPNWLVAGIGANPCRLALSHCYVGIHVLSGSCRWLQTGVSAGRLTETRSVQP